MHRASQGKATPCRSVCLTLSDQLVKVNRSIKISLFVKTGIFILLLFLFLPVTLFSQVNKAERMRIEGDSILSSRGELVIGIPNNLRKSALQAIPDLSPGSITDSLSMFYVNKEQFVKITESGTDYRIMPVPSMISPVKMAGKLDDILNGQAYPTYSQYLDLMKYFGEKYPEICTIDTIGRSMDGRLILAARLQRGAYNAGEKPIVFYTSTMHGDETTGYSMMLLLINEILKNKDASEQISSLLDELVLIINPLSNPDGTYFLNDSSIYGARRFNEHTIDLNRDYPKIKRGMQYTLIGLEPENIYMVKYMEKYRPSLSANFHTGAEVLNYPWDSWYSTEHIHADDAWFVEICKDYVDSARSIDPYYLRLYSAGYVFGSEWYRIEGGRQDFVTYNLRGREITIELSNVTLPPATEMWSYWEKNRAGLIGLIEKAEFGVHGTVTNGLTFQPMEAKIEIPGHDQNESFIYSDPVTGKFFRYLAEGTHQFTVSAEGFTSAGFSAEVHKNEKTEVTVTLDPVQTGILLKTLAGNEGIEIALNDDGSEVFSASLYDLTGRKVDDRLFIGRSGIVEKPVSEGIYILKIKTEHQTLSRLVFF
jgi:hypothetical protein